MHTETLNFLQTYLNMNGISSLIFPYTGEYASSVPDYDHGLRRHFFTPADAENHLLALLSNIPNNTVVYTKDEFRCHYVFLRIPKAEAFMSEEAYSEQILVIGPYLLETCRDNSIQEIANKLKLSPSGHSYLRKYIHNLTVTHRSIWFRNLITLTASRLYHGDNCYKESFIEVQSELDTTSTAEPKMAPELHILEERYATMRLLLTSVRGGNTDQALRHLLHFRSMSGGHRFKNSLKDAKNWLIIFNTQLRMTAESAGVHPYNLDETSSIFAYKIDAMTSEEGQSVMMQQMIRKYCDLINQQNLDGYSKIIRDVILRIRTSLHEDLSLSILAAEMNLNASYLSSRFSRETGMKLTEYINRSRIEASLPYMNDPEIPIKEILPEIGIYDLNYFSRLFRRYIGMSPTEYQKQLSQKSGI
ncbi:MAG: AraC family transcriptional regulator [Lachnospiraceae bacterium]|nr:AraC family transcriptional regulator [Lachnospiraceae bacterium]